MTAPSPSRISQLWQRFRDPSKEFKRSHTEELFKLLREQQSQIEQLEAPVKEVMAQSEDFDGVNTIAYIRALHKKLEGQRKHIATLEAKLLTAPGHGNATADADRQVGARTAGEAPASDGDSACPAVPIFRAYDEAMQAAGVPHEPLQVYDSNSWRRVGLARQYREVMAPTVTRDWQPDIRGTDVLVALVAAFNAMLTIRPGDRAAPEAPAVPSKFDLAFEVMRLMGREELDTLQSCHFGYVLRVEREKPSPKLYEGEGRTGVFKNCGYHGTASGWIIRDGTKWIATLGSEEEANQYVAFRNAPPPCEGPP